MVVALLLTTVASAMTNSSRASESSSPAPIGLDASSYLYYNGTVNGNGGVQTVNVPAPANGTVWDLVSAKITITSSSGASGSQNSYLYDSTCTQADVSPAPSACVGLYGPNVDSLANDVMDSGKSGTIVSEGGYASSTPAGVSFYTHYDQTIHLNHDMFISFGADLSTHVSSTYYLVFDPEVGDYPSFAFFRWGNPVESLSGTAKTITIAGPPAGHYYRAEIAVSTLDLSSVPGPTRSAEIVEEPAGTVLTLIDDWTVRSTGITEDACGGYSTGQTCTSDPTGTATVWANQVVVNSGDSLEAKFVGVAGDSGVFAVIVTEYPAAPAAPTGLAASSSTTSSLTWSWTNPAGTLTDDYLFWEAGSACSAATEVNLGAVADSYVLGSLASGTEYCAYVEASSAGGTSSASTVATGTTAPTNPPAAPTNLTAAPANASAIELTWTNPGGPLVDDLIDQYSSSICSGTPTVVDVGSVVASYAVGNLSADTTYGYEVAASNLVGEGPWSACANATTEANATNGGGSPAAPTNLSATAASSSSIDLSWTNPSGALLDDYVATYSSLECTGSAVSINLGAVAQTFVSSGLSASTTYSFEVEASNSAGIGPASICAAATTASNGGVAQNNSSALDLTATTPVGDVVPGLVVQVEFQVQSQNLSVTLAPTDGTGNGSYYDVPAGTTIANVTLIGQNYSLNSYTVVTPATNVLQLIVVVTPVTPAGNNTTSSQWVQFSERGLPADVTWWVSVAGPANESLTSSGKTINFDLENGTYPYAIGAYSGYNASVPSGVLVVPSAPSNFVVNFTNQPGSTRGPPSPGSGFGASSSALLQTLAVIAVAIALVGSIVCGTFLSARRRMAPLGSPRMATEVYDGTMELLRSAPARTASAFGTTWRALRRRTRIRSPEPSDPMLGERTGTPSLSNGFLARTRGVLVSTASRVRGGVSALARRVRARLR